MLRQSSWRRGARAALYSARSTGGVTAAVAGFDVGAGGEEEDGVRCASLVGGEVKAGAPALVEVVNGVREGDKRVLAGGRRRQRQRRGRGHLRGAEGRRRRWRGGRRERGGGDAVGEGDETSGMGVAGGEGRARVASGFEDVATYYRDGDAGVFGAKLRDGLVVKAVSVSEIRDGLVARARRGVRRDKESGGGDVGRTFGGRSGRSGGRGQRCAGSRCRSGRGPIIFCPAPVWFVIAAFVLKSPSINVLYLPHRIASGASDDVRVRRTRFARDPSVRLRLRHSGATCLRRRRELCGGGAESPVREAAW